VEPFSKAEGFAKTSRVLFIAGMKLSQARHLISWCEWSRSAAVVFALLVTISSARSAEIYSGEPLGEALYDLSSVCVLIAHELATSTPLARTDVFKLPDGRLLALMSKSAKAGEPYSIESIRITSDSKTALTLKTAKVSSLDLQVLKRNSNHLLQLTR
jgi:hypothetical protein